MSNRTEPLYVNELVDDEGDLLWEVTFLGAAIASTYSRQQLDCLLEALNRPVRWLVPA